MINDFSCQNSSTLNLFASCSSGNAFVSGTGGLRFKSRASQIGYSVANGLPTTCHRCDISLNGAVLPGRNDAIMGPANSLHALAYYCEYNERFDLKNNKF